MKIKVIKITFGEKVGYLASTGYHEYCGTNAEKIVDNPLSAINYALPKNEANLERDLGCLYVTGIGGAKSGIRADFAELIEFETDIQEVSRQTVRQGKKE